MKVNQAFQIFQQGLFCALLVALVAGCSPIAPVPTASESLTLQSVEQYERTEAIKILEQIDPGGDPNLESSLEAAKAELIEEGTYLGLPEELIPFLEESILVPSESILLPDESSVLPDPGDYVLLPKQSVLLPEGSTALPPQTDDPSWQSLQLPEGSTALPGEYFVLPKASVNFLEQTIELPEQAVELPEQSIIVPEQSTVLQGEYTVLPEEAFNLGQDDQIPIAERIVLGIPTIAWPAVGALLIEHEPGYYQTWCTATLIGCDTVLTAAHCVDHNPQPEQLKVFFQSAGTVNVTEIHKHPEFSEVPNNDIAILRLEQPIDGIRPETINTNVPLGADVTGILVGFGRSSGARTDYGLKRYGRITTANCIGSLSDENLICWNFLALNDLESANTCNGDSGGPFFYPEWGQRQVSGVISGGRIESCSAGDHSFNVRVSRYSDWIVTNSGSVGADRCGELPSVYEPAVTVQGASGILSTTTKYELHDFEIAPGTQLLRITLNGQDPAPNINNYDLYVRYATEPDRTTFDCASTNDWQYESCEIQNPTPGTWYALVDRVFATSGPGEYQVVATIFATDE